MKSRLRELPWEIVILSVSLLSLIGLVAVIILSYQSGKFGTDQAHLYIVSASVISNTVLITAYVLTLIHERNQVQLNKEAEIHKDMLSDVIQESLLIVEENRRIFIMGYGDGKFPNRLDFLIKDPDFMYPYLTYSNREKFKIYESEFLPEYDSVYENMKHHDDLLIELMESEQLLVEAIYEVIKIENDGHTEPLIKENQMALSRVIMMVIRGVDLHRIFGSEDEKDIEDAQEVRNEIRYIIDNYLDSLDRGVRGKRLRYLEFCDRLCEDLVEARKRTKREYGISSSEFNDKGTHH